MFCSTFLAVRYMSEIKKFLIILSHFIWLQAALFTTNEMAVDWKWNIQAIHVWLASYGFRLPSENACVCVFERAVFLLKNIFIMVDIVIRKTSVGTLFCWTGTAHSIHFRLSLLRPWAVKIGRGRMVLIVCQPVSSQVVSRSIIDWSHKNRTDRKREVLTYFQIGHLMMYVLS